jgi:uncharacterized SAM-binding protein YcdF (DUF218 family)
MIHIDGIRASQLRHITELLLHPLFIGFIVAVILITCLFRQVGDTKSIALGLALVCVGSVVLSTSFLPRWMSVKLEDQYARVTQIDPNVHWVVVLGGGVSGIKAMPASDALSSASLRRFLEGLRVYRQLPKAKLILSGGSRRGMQYANSVRYNELAEMFDVPETDRVLEGSSINTADEARLIKPWLKDEPFYLVTSATHMPRSMALFEHQGLHPIAAPCDYTGFQYENQLFLKKLLPNTGNLVSFNAAWHEYLGSLWAKLRKIRA